MRPPHETCYVETDDEDMEDALCIGLTKSGPEIDHGDMDDALCIGLTRLEQRLPAIRKQVVRASRCRRPPAQGLLRSIETPRSTSRSLKRRQNEQYETGRGSLRRTEQLILPVYAGRYPLHRIC